MITNVKDLCDHLSADNQKQAERHVYKYTDCGAWIQFDDNGITLGSIVEGCDFGTMCYPLNYPFSAEDYNARIAAIEKEATDLWGWANEIVENDMTGAELGTDAPDTFMEFLHLNPDRRSA